MAAVVTLSVSGVSYTVLNSSAVEQSAEQVAGQATCRTVESAIVAYAGAHGVPPRSVADLAGYVDGDIRGYRIVGGRAAGPGC